MGVAAPTGLALHLRGIACQCQNWGDNDAPYSFAKFSVWSTALNQEQIKSVVAAK